MKIDSEKILEYLGEQREYQLTYNPSECYIAILEFINEMAEWVYEMEEV